MKEHSSRHWSKLSRGLHGRARRSPARARDREGPEQRRRRVREDDAQWTIFTFQGETRGGAPLYSPIHE